MRRRYLRAGEEVEAVEWTGTNGDEIMRFLDEGGDDAPPAYVDLSTGTPRLNIATTLNPDVTWPPGVLVIRDGVGEIIILPPYLAHGLERLTDAEERGDG